MRGKTPSDEAEGNGNAMKPHASRVNLSLRETAVEFIISKPTSSAKRRTRRSMFALRKAVARLIIKKRKRKGDKKKGVKHH